MRELPRTLRHATVWLLLGTVLFLALQWWQDRARRTAFRAEGGVVELQRGPDGHWHWPGQVNGRAVEFLVDTGATRSALPRSLARSLDLPEEGTLRLDTAAGPATGTVVRADLNLDGGVHAQRLRLVALDGLAQPLLGLDVLGRLHWQQRGGVLRIEPQPR